MFWRTSFKMRNTDNMMWWQHNNEFEVGDSKRVNINCFIVDLMVARYLRIVWTQTRIHSTKERKKEAVTQNRHNQNQDLINNTFSCSCQTLIYRSLTKLLTITNDTFQNIFLLSFFGIFRGKIEMVLLWLIIEFSCREEKNANEKKYLEFYLAIN